MIDSVLRIAVCDDSDIEAETVRQKCLNFFTSRDVKTDISLFSSGTSFLADDNKYDLLFLDVELGDMNGIEVMHRVEASKKVWKIIFITGYSDYMPDAFGPLTIGFISKPFDDHKFTKYLSSFYREMILVIQPVISFNGCDSINVCDILYIKSIGSYFSIVLVDSGEQERISGSITKFIEETNKGIWVRISRGLYINLHHVKSHNHRSVTLSNGEVLPISAKYAEDFVSRLSQFIRDLRR